MSPKRTYHKNGRIATEAWLNEAGVYHKLDGPAFREWFGNRQLMQEVSYVNGKLHRLDGPAVREWYSNGHIECEMWFINGVEYETEAEFQVAVDLYKANEIAELF